MLNSWGTTIPPQGPYFLPASLALSVLVFGGARSETQSLTHSREVLYHQATLQMPPRAANQTPSLPHAMGALCHWIPVQAPVFNQCHMKGCKVASVVFFSYLFWFLFVVLICISQMSEFDHLFLCSLSLCIRSSLEKYQFTCFVFCFCCCLRHSMAM